MIKNTKRKLKIGKTTYTVTAKFTQNGNTTAKGKLLRLMENDIEKFSKNAGNLPKGVVEYN